MTWKVTGVSWSRLAVLPGAFFGAVAALTYGVLRLGLSRPLALLAVLPSVISTPNFMIVPQLRDYAKGPFLLATILLMGALVMGSSDRRRVVWLSAIGGAVIGIGLGFRFDLIIAVPPFVLAVAFLVPAGVTIPTRVRRCRVPRGAGRGDRSAAARFVRRRQQCRPRRVARAGGRLRSAAENRAVGLPVRRPVQRHARVFDHQQLRHPCRGPASGRQSLDCGIRPGGDRLSETDRPGVSGRSRDARRGGEPDDPEVLPRFIARSAHPGAVAVSAGAVLPSREDSVAPRPGRLRRGRARDADRSACATRAPPASSCS